MQARCSTSLVPAESARVSGAEVVEETKCTPARQQPGHRGIQDLHERNTTCRRTVTGTRLGSSLAIGPLSLFDGAPMQQELGSAAAWPKVHFNVHQSTGAACIKTHPKLFASTPSGVASRPRGDSSETGRARRDDTTSQTGLVCACSPEGEPHVRTGHERRDSTLTNGHAGTSRTAPCGSATFPEIELGPCRSRATSQRSPTTPAGRGS
jgi:hypothetical protein